MRLFKVAGFFLAAVVLILFGGVCWLWSIGLFVWGGPDAQFGTPETITWGIGFVVAGFVAIGLGIGFVRVGMRSVRAWVQ